MSELPETAVLHASAPELGGDLPRGAPLGPRALFCTLAVESEDHMEVLRSAFHFVDAALAGAALPEVEASSEAALVDGWIAWARGQLSPFAADDYGSSWPVRLVREFAPVGLTDGGWLSAGFIEHGDAARRQAFAAQLGQRLGADEAHESHARRYGLLLASLGIPLQAITRWEFEETAQCADISYEHGLLGLTLGLFPSWFALETLGFELWMSAVGPCPLLADLRDELSMRELCTRYFDCYDHAALTARARAQAIAALGADAKSARRIARGFAAAHASYQRWAQAMLGANVPYTPRDFVLEGVRRKARFAIDHHHEVELKGHNLATLLREGGRSHEILLDHLAETASLVKPGAPDRSPLITHALSLDGPMFDAFTAAEKNDLREWIAGLGREHKPVMRTPVPLAGAYLGAVDREAQRAALEARYGALSNSELMRCLKAEDAHPGACSRAIELASAWCSAFEEAFASDERLAAYRAPTYTPRAVLALADPRHERAGAPADIAAERGFLRGIVDVRRIEFEDYGFLLQRYLASDPRADIVGDERWELLARGLSLGTRRFLPELLGLNLGLELLHVERTEQQLRLGVRAVQAYFDRVVETMPDELEALWARVHAAARLPHVIAHGSPSEIAALEEHWLARAVDASALAGLATARRQHAGSP